VVAERLELLRQAADTLAYLHGQGLSHGNLKPSNVLVLDAPNGVKLLDFEAAMPRAASEERPPGAALDPGPDIHGLGSLLASVLEGGGSDTEIGAEVRRISRKASAESSHTPYRTIQEFAADLTGCVSHASRAS
jgi:serine/threonine protein kinase